MSRKKEKIPVFIYEFNKELISTMLKSDFFEEKRKQWTNVRMFFDSFTPLPKKGFFRSRRKNEVY